MNRQVESLVVHMQGLHGQDVYYTLHGGSSTIAIRNTSKLYRATLARMIAEITRSFPRCIIEYTATTDTLFFEPQFIEED